MTVPVGVIVFDVNETLSDMTPLADHLAATGCGDLDLAAWFAGMLRDGFALATTGGYAPFGELVRSSLTDMLTRRGCTREQIDDAVSRVVMGFGDLDAHPDVSEGMASLHGAGYRLVTLTNGATAMTEGMLQRAGVLELLENRLSVDEVRHWKPAPQSYAFAEHRCDSTPSTMALVASHPWDIHGAVTAGWTGVWVNRDGATYPPTSHSPIWW